MVVSERTSFYERVKEALENRDAVKYARLIDESGREPEAPDLYEQGLLEISLEESQNRAHEERLFRDFERRRLSDFVDEADERGLTKSSVFEYTSAKREMLRDYFGLERVCVAKGTFVPIEEADRARVGMIFRERLNYSKKRLRKL